MIEIMKFGAKWCQPCKRYDPILDEVVGDRDDVFLTKVDIEEDPALASKYQVMSVPFTVFRRGDEVLGGFKGATTAAKLNGLIDGFKE